MNPLFQIPENLADLSAEALHAFIDATVARLQEVAADAASFQVDGRTGADIRAEVTDAIAALAVAREALAKFEAEEPPVEAEPVEGDEPAEEPAEGDELVEADEPAEAEPVEGDPDPDLAADVAALAAEALEPPAITAAAPPARRRAPARSRSAAPQESAPAVALTAGAGAGLPLGAEFPSAEALALAMMDRRRSFGLIAEGDQDKVAIARASWGHLYPEERQIFGKDIEVQAALIASVVDQKAIRSEFVRRQKLGVEAALTASGGLCAPVTPYYNLQMISVAERPVRAALPAFNADRGGIRAARPASLAAITTGVGAMTVAQDAAGGTTGTKTCQSLDCPSFVETDVEILFHCLKFGNLGARTFPERVAQWNNLVLAAHARLGDRTLLTGIDTNSTAVTAASLGLGASSDLLSQVLVAAAGMRSRHRMDPQAVLRLLMPNWVLPLLVSDVYRSQFGRFDMTPEKFVALLRAAGVEPSFYIDSAAGKNQEFGVQNAGALLAFPPTVTWYLYPEGSFLYIDGGVLELGLVRDSVLNSTNDFEIFGESFENVAFIGVESLAVTSTVCDTGITGGTHNVLCPIDYTHTS